MSQTATWAVPSAPSGLAMRNTVNTIVDVLRSSSSGASAPSPTVAGMFWFDDGVIPAVLRQRNASNTEWIRIIDTADAAASRSALGITPLTNGVIIGTRWIQWGSFTPPNNSSQQWGVTFATAFPTACRAVVANINNNTIAIGTVATYGLTTTGFAFGQNWIGGQTGNLSIYWEAMGD